MSDNYRALPRGTRLLDYVIEGVLGQGSFGITYLAVELSTNIKVAIKEYYPREFATRDTTLTVRASGNKDDRDNFKWGLERFGAESRVIALFKHPNIIGVKRFFNANGTAYLVMEYCDGIPLDERLRQVGSPSQTELVKLINPILDALELIHNSKYLHRDVKPGNIYIRTDGTPILLDFGAARQDLVSHSRSITSLATPGYAPYEQYSTDSQQGPSADIYGFAATLYRVVVGKRPIDSPSRFMDDTLEKASNVALGKYDQAILKAIDAGLELRPSNRPVSVAEWRKIFGSTLSSHGSPKRVDQNSDFVRVDLDDVKSSSTMSKKDESIALQSGPSKLLSIFGLALVLVLVVLGYIHYLDSNRPKITPKPVAIPLANTVAKPDSSNPVDPDPAPRKNPQPSSATARAPQCPSNQSSSSWTNCVGTYTFPAGGKNAGDRYTGSFKDGYFHGKGVYVAANGERYEGNLSMGNKDGYGTFYNTKGVIEYRGIWKNNLPINEMIVTPDSARSSDLTLAQCNELADYLKKDLPKKLDSITIWTRNSCSMGSNRPIFTYWYEIDTNDDFTQSTVNYLREDAKRKICGKSLEKIISGLDIKYNYVYSSKKNNNYIGALYFSLSDCRK